MLGLDVWEGVSRTCAEHIRQRLTPLQNRPIHEDISISYSSREYNSYYYLLTRLLFLPEFFEWCWELLTGYYNYPSFSTARKWRVWRKATKEGRQNIDYPPSL
jgi:hypothetical protein